MIKDINQIRWGELKSRIRQRWSKLTEEDVSQLNGNIADLIALLRKRYGYGKAQAEIEISNWLQDSIQRARTHK